MARDELLSGGPPPKFHEPLSQSLAVVTAAPYIELVDITFEKFLNRPPTYYNKEKHLMVTRIMECLLLPLALMTFVVLCLIRMFYLPHWLGIRVAPWPDIIFLQPMAHTFSLLPVALPTIWSLLECVGNMKIWKSIEQATNYRAPGYQVETRLIFPLRS